MLPLHVFLIVCEIFTFGRLVSARNSTVKPYPANCMDLLNMDYSGKHTICAVRGNSPDVKKRDCQRKNCCWSFVPKSKTDMECYQQPSDKPTQSSKPNDSPKPNVDTGSKPGAKALAGSNTSGSSPVKTLKGSPKNAKICEQLSANPSERTTCKVPVTLVNEETCLQSNCCWIAVPLVPAGFACFNPPDISKTINASPRPNVATKPAAKASPPVKILKGSPKNAKICEQMSANPSERTTCKVSVTLVNEDTCLQSNCCWIEAPLVPAGFACYNPPKV